VFYALTAGAEGYLLKQDADTELFAAIEKIRQGEHYISPLLSGKLTSDLIRAAFQNGPVISPPDPLTVREKEVLKLIAEGVSNQEIADMLYISIRTVEHHRENIMKKLKTKKMASLVKYAIQQGYTSPIQ
jgi:DNA-binding NarL/FixJ family response regulator